MRCREVQQRLNSLCDGERLYPAWLYLGTARHFLACADCREVWWRLRRARQLSRWLPRPPVPPSLDERVFATLCEAPTTPTIVASGWSLTAVQMARAVVVVALIVAGLVVVPWNRSRPVGASVEAAVQGTNTWHLKGWKLRNGQRIPWEIWGRRVPFFYREQLGDELNFDDGTQRVRLIPNGGAGQRLALRLASGPAPSDQWSQWLTMGAGWRRLAVLQESRAEVLLRGGLDGGMQGPYSVSQAYFRVDKKTWLPMQWEYRLHWMNSNAPEQVTDILKAEYDVPLNEGITTLRLPTGVRMVDTLGKPADSSLPTENVQRAQGLTVRARALAMDPDGNILVRVSSWLGNMKLGAEGTGTWNSVGTDIRYRTYGQTQDTAFHTDDGRSYVEFRLPRVWLDLLSTGDALKILAPLEPRPRGAQFPRNLTMNLEVAPNVMAGGGSSILFRQEFTLTVSLPEQTAHINIDDFLPPAHRQQMRFAPRSDQSTVAGNIAGARASQYELQGNFGRAIYWHQRGLPLVEPFTNDAQLRRLALAHTYQEAHDLPRAAAMYREVIRISRDHPETWNYYAFQAKGGLDYLARHRR